MRYIPASSAGISFIPLWLMERRRDHSYQRSVFDVKRVEIMLGPHQVQD